MKNDFNVVKFSNKPIKNFLSVIIPVYSDPEGIQDTLGSLMKQTFDKENFEIIVANDGGDKKTKEVSKQYDKIRILNIEQNQGSYNARNIGLKESKGENIAFIDANIKALENWMENGYELLKKYDYVGGEVRIDKKKLKSLSHYYEYLTSFENEKKLKNYHYIPTANLFVKRRLIEDIGGFDVRLWSGGDTEFGDRVYRTGKYKMCFSKNLVVIHPPRDQKSLIKKMSRVQDGMADLERLYPQRFQQTKPKIFIHIKDLLTPMFKVLFSKRKINFLKRIILSFWCVYLSFLILLKLIIFKKFR